MRQLEPDPHDPTPGLAGSAGTQGLTLVHFSAQSEPFLTQNNP